MVSFCYSFASSYHSGHAVATAAPPPTLSFSLNNSNNAIYTHSNGRKKIKIKKNTPSTKKNESLPTNYAAPIYVVIAGLELASLASVRVRVVPAAPKK